MKRRQHSIAARRPRRAVGWQATPYTSAGLKVAARDATGRSKTLIMDHCLARRAPRALRMGRNLPHSSAGYLTRTSLEYEVPPEDAVGLTAVSSSPAIL